MTVKSSPALLHHQHLLSTMNVAGICGHSVPADSQHDSTAETQPVSLRFNSKGEFFKNF